MTDQPRRLCIAWMLVLNGLLVAAAASATPQASGNTVIVLSWDGLRHDYVDRGNLPALQRISREGVRAERMRSVFPSDTFPSHVSLASGTYPDVHGIVANQFFDRELGTYWMSAETHWLQAEPLWIAAERQGVAAATYFWVGSEQDWRGQGIRYRIAPFDGERPEARKVEQILQWLNLPLQDRPGLIMCYWRGTDHAGHRYGPNSTKVMAALQQQDAQLDRLLQALDAQDRWGEVTLIIVSDHGMTVAGDYLPVREALAEAGIPATMLGQTVLHVFLEQVAQRDAALTTIRAVHPALEVYPGDALPARWRLQHPSRSGDLVIAAPPPFVLSRPAGFEGLVYRVFNALGWDYGGHGYDPGLADMGASFLAMGRGVAAGERLTEVRAIDVAATVAQLLQIDPPLQSEGVPIDLRGAAETASDN
ncbi:MAG: ectonucleotide pyrophosphatase/phosphodiesterase [Pseudomonadales bacterium]